MDPDLLGPDLPEPRFTGRIHFLRQMKLMKFDPDIRGRNLSPPSPPINWGPTAIRKRIKINIVFPKASVSLHYIVVYLVNKKDDN